MSAADTIRGLVERATEGPFFLDSESGVYTYKFGEKCELGWFDAE